MSIRHLFITVICSLWLHSEGAWAEKPFAPEVLQGVIRVDAEETVELMVNIPGLLVIDSRKENVYLKGHIQGAINLLDTEMTPGKLSRHAPDQSTPLLFYCDGEQCLRSSRAATTALAWGYKSIYWFRGGWNEWIEKSLPISH